jgi:hypothetical protein
MTSIYVAIGAIVAILLGGSEVLSEILTALQ